MTSTNSQPAAPAVLPRAVLIIGTTAAAFVILAGMRSAAWLLGPVILAMVVVIAASPFPRWLRKKGVPGWLATTALIVVIYGGIVGLVLVLVVSVASLASLLPTYADRANDLVNGLTSAMDKFGVGPDEIRQAASGLDFAKITAALESVLGAVSSLLSNLLFLLALLLFLSFESASSNIRRARFATDRPGVMDSLSAFLHNTRRYLIVTTIFGFLVAVLDVAALWIMGIPLAVLWGVLAFLTNYIPNVGFIIGLLPPALLALLDGGWGKLVAVVAVYGVLNFVLQSLVQPRFIGNAVGLSSTITFLSLILWAWVLGPIGAVLAIPLSLLVKAILVDPDPRARWVNAMIGSIAPTNKKDPRDRLYRRLADAYRARRHRTAEPGPEPGPELGGPSPAAGT
jgi:AI-2 transport protein TqsA